MKTCPRCKVEMLEFEEPNQIGAAPQLLPEGEPLTDVHRVRYQCPECQHLEAAFPEPKK